MNLDLRYLGHSGVRSVGAGLELSFAPNLARPKVFFDGEVVHPIRFREAISALHDVVVGDLRFRVRDKTAYKQWREDQVRREAELRAQVTSVAKARELERVGHEPMPAHLEQDFRKMHDLYWRARRRWASELATNDPELFRHLVPCDPVVTVAPDVVFFECFSKDESSYGCLSVDRDAFGGESAAGLGTTNVDYSLALYDHFQTLRSYRPTRLLVDPTGFEVNVEGLEAYREEKIDLPASWLRGFGQLQAAMGLPVRRVPIPREALYSVLAWLKRHREKTGPRSIRFQLTPGEPPALVLDPWGVRIECRGAVYQGERAEEIKVWGRRRLFTLARVLPLAERIEVRLLGSGLPSFWALSLGEMRFVLALSGWTTNDWAAGANLDLLSGAHTADPVTIGEVEGLLERRQRATLEELAAAIRAPHDTLLGALHTLSKQGQVVYDFAADVYRYRRVMPVELSEAMLGPEHPELVHGRMLYGEGRVTILREEFPSPTRRLLVATVGDTPVEAVFDADGKFARAKCSCSFFYKSRLRAGPCRHLLALRLRAQEAGEGERL